MIKKYITLAALLSAGTALANANEWKNRNWQDTGKDVIITTTFSNSTTSTTSVTGSYNSGVSVNPTFSNSDFITGGTAGSSSIVPNINVGNGSSSWSLNLDYSFGGLVGQLLPQYQASLGFQIESVEIKLGAVDTNGNFLGYVPGTVNRDGNTYNFKLTLTPGDSSGTAPINLGKTSWIESTGINSTLYGTGPDSDPLVFDFQNGSWTPDASQSDVLPQSSSLSFLVGSAEGSKAGTIGIQSITLKTSLMKQGPDIIPDSPGVPGVPEPSAFGLLAGLGALALVASRRRRK